MKSIEEKAKAYDEALEVLHKYDGANIMFSQSLKEEMFPELAESEDERIRNFISNELACLRATDGKGSDRYKELTNALAWLEKQAEHANFRNKIQIGDKVTRNEDGVLVNLSQLKRVAKKDEKQGEQKHTAEEVLIKAGLKPYKDGDQWCILLGDNIQEGICGFGNTIEDALYAFLKDLIASQSEQKPADKVETKFHEGEWIIGRATNNEPRQISEVTKQCYRTTYGGQYGFSFEDDMHLWTIQDAKDGDVLSWDYGRYIMIFKELKDNIIIAHCSYNNHIRHLGTQGNYDTTFSYPYKSIPATKEQREQLEKAMADAGYKWDAEKKELKKIEQEPAKNEELTEFDKAVGVSIGTWNPKTPEQIQAVKSLSNKLLKLAKKQINNEQKPAEWSEEDSKNINSLIGVLDERMNSSDEGTIVYDYYKSLQVWLKSLKDRVLPQPKQEWSEEDEETMSKLLSLLLINHPDVWKTFGDWLNSLKERYTWNPSEEQISLLQAIVNEPNNAASESCQITLKEVIRQLKKLKKG